jgi:hypothetical protein
MSNYILISSAYRDRILYPNPSDFIVPFQQIQSSIINRFDVLNTINPISVFPIYNFCWTNFQSNSNAFSTSITGGGGSNIKLYPNVQLQLLGLLIGPNVYVNQTIKNCENILNGYNAMIKDSAGNTFESKIIAYSPIYNSITTLEPLPFNVGQNLEIINTSAISASEIKITGNYNSILTLDNNLYLYNITLNEIRKCSLDGISNVLKCESNFSGSIGYTDKYLLYNTLYPFILGNIEKFRNGQYFVESALSQFNILHKGIGYIQQELVYLTEKNELLNSRVAHCCLLKVKRIGPSGCIEELEIYDIGCQNFKRSINYLIVPINRRPGIEYATLFMVETSTIFKCKVKNNKNIPIDLRGNYFTCFLLSPLYEIKNQILYTSPNKTIPVEIPNVSPDLYQSQQLCGVSGIHNTLISKDGSLIIFVQKISPLLLDRFRYYELLTVEQQTNPAYSDALNFCIQNFVREGVVPLNFSGSYFTQSQMSCYEITILNLILPNVEIDSLNSLLTSGFPYVLLEISNVTMPNSGNKNVIYSNNPAVINSTFVCSISDINDPIKTKFIKISSDGTIQTIKFSPADNLRFRILLPSGEPFKILQNDYLPPSFANPKLQIESLIELKRI